MSTEHQQYSTQNQIECIARYAKLNGFEIVRTYADLGRSGLTLQGREGLGNLLGEVVSGRADYSVILVYDVSRWGRFQDVDESAHYEFVCRRADVRIEYCAEQFRNDGTLPSTLMKTIKRTMAGEYSRELSDKVFAGQSRLARLGFKQGGCPGYGLNRVLLAEDGRPKQVLLPGQRKSLQSERVIVAPSSSDEVSIVREIFDRCTKKRESAHKIAKALNARGVSWKIGKPWTRGIISTILTSAKYAGVNVYARTTQKLKSKPKANPREKWIQCENAFHPIVSLKQFNKAAEVIAARRPRRITKEQLLDSAREVFLRYGELSYKHIDEAEGAPCPGSYLNHFGGIIPLYQTLGCQVPAKHRYRERRHHVRVLKRRLWESIVQQLRASGSIVEYKVLGGPITINKEFTAVLRLATLRKMTTGAIYWGICMLRSIPGDITIIARLGADLRDVLDYYLFPRSELLPGMLRIHLENGPLWDSCRFDNLDVFFALARRVSAWELTCGAKYRELATSLRPDDAYQKRKRTQLLLPGESTPPKRSSATLNANSVIRAS